MTKVMCSKITCKHITRNSKQQTVCSLDVVSLVGCSCVFFKHHRDDSKKNGGGKNGDGVALL